MLKKKNIYVITITVFVVFLVIVSAFLGLIIYLQWRQLDFAVNYYETMERLDTISDAKNIQIDSLKIKLGFERLPAIEGHIWNKGKRSIISIAVKINFLDVLNKTVYSYVIYPLEPFRPQGFFKKVHFSNVIFLKEAMIQPGKEALFKCTMWGCPKKFVKQLKKNAFSNAPGEWCGQIATEILRIRLK